MDVRMPRAYKDAPAHVPRGVVPGTRVAQPGPDEVVLFVIGMQVHRWRRVRSWWPVFTAMPRMLRELQQHPEVGLLGAHTLWAGRTFLVLQYWSSPEALGAFARDGALSHAPAWAAFNRAVAGTGDVGIFHETYVVDASRIETRYGNVRPFGLAAAVGHTNVYTGRRSRAEERVGTDLPE